MPKGKPLTLVASADDFRGWATWRAILRWWKASTSMPLADANNCRPAPSRSYRIFWRRDFDMAIQDLTPQLRTRLRRVEKIVGVFVILATLVLLVGFGYYLYDTGQRKGWFIPKCPYFTFVQSAEGLKIGNPVVLMGFEVGNITTITAQSPASIESSSGWKFGNRTTAIFGRIRRYASRRWVCWVVVVWRSRPVRRGCRQSRRPAE